MDKWTRRIRCNSDGSFVIKHVDNALMLKDGINMGEKVVTIKEGVSTSKQAIANEEVLNHGWETEIEYY
ncbi:hypothetical protein [Bacillus sp. FSL K6-3431]|uniref:hypothetical protein n=1 Tax=Bacillus sp. FSL K6-3431 TaxID=2921500 RepID=UPI0030FA093D